MNQAIKIPTIFVLIFAVVIIPASQKKIFLSHDQSNDEDEIFRFFHDVKDGYYVDIGAYDPIFISNTINLYSRGWDGINVESHPVRFSQVAAVRDEDLNLNFAMSDKLSYFTMYEYALDVSQSTLVQDVYKNMPSREAFSTIEVPTMTMKELCHRYFKRKPNYINLDIQGVTGITLKSNDWSNPLCRADVIFAEKDNVPHKISWKVTQKQIMKNVGYKFVSQYVFNEIYIQESVYDFYMAKYKQGKKILNQMTVINSKKFLIDFYEHLKVPQPEFSQFKKHTYRLNFTHSYFYYFYPKQGSTFCLEDINRKSNRLSPYKNRPILIQQFNPENTYIYTKSKQYKKQVLKVKEYFFEKISIKKDDGEEFITYIFISDTDPQNYSIKSTQNVITSIESQKNKGEKIENIIQIIDKKIAEPIKPQQIQKLDKKEIKKEQPIRQKTSIIQDIKVQSNQMINYALVSIISVLVTVCLFMCLQKKIFLPRYVQKHIKNQSKSIELQEGSNTQQI